MKFYNTNERYGDEGPFEAESKEGMADEMMERFREWAIEASIYDTDAHDEEGNIVERWIDQYVASMREEFIGSLEE